MKSDEVFQSMLRPLHELRQAAGWALACLWAVGYSLFSAFSLSTVAILIALCSVMAFVRALDARQLARRKLSLMGRKISFLKIDSLLGALPKMGNNLWLGWGYRWQPSHTRRAAEVMRHDIEDVYPPSWVRRLLRVDRNPATERGMQWIHGLEPEERDILVPFDALKGHCAIIATTGSIKTRLLSMIAAQLAGHGDTIIVIDPKGDGELKEICRQVAIASGDPKRFLSLHPAFASESVRIDLLKNWDRVSQVASRVSLVLGAQQENSFSEFCWNAVHSITSGLKYVGRRVNIFSLRIAIDSRVSVERLTEEALEKFFATDGAKLRPLVDQTFNALAGAGPQKQKGKGGGLAEVSSMKLAAMAMVFQQYLAEDHSEARRTGNIEKPEEIRGLISILEANKEWFGKMIVSIKPMLTKLSTDDLRSLLSPDYDDINDPRPIMDMRKIVQGNYIFYVGTDALADSSVSRALAAMLMADTSSVAAEIYNHGLEGDDGAQRRRIHVFVDEWGDVMCEPLIQQANKGRGAGIFLWALGQTLSDLTDALSGNKSKALRFMGNMNNLIVGATQDAETMKLITDKFGKTTVPMRSRSKSSGSKTEDSGMEFSGTSSDSVSEREAELFPPSLLPGLPDLHYVAMINRSEFIKGRIPVVTT